MTHGKKGIDMQSVEEAISFLRERTGLRQIDMAFGRDVELVFDGSTSVYFSKISDTELELTSRLTPFGAHPPADMMGRLLHAGWSATGGARISLDPRTGRVNLSERLDVSSVDGAVFEQCVMSFVVRSRAFNAMSPTTLPAAPHA